MVEDIRFATANDLTWLAAVAKRETQALGFLPNVIIQDAIARGECKVHEKSRSFIIYHVRRDGITKAQYMCVPQMTRGKGIGKALMLSLPRPIVLKCVAFIPSNEFFRHIGFRVVGWEQSKTRPVNVWRLDDE